MLGDCKLPAFRAIVSTALERVRDDAASSAEIADLMSSDPGLSVRLLGTVNSAAFALRHQVRSVHHAVSLLGRNQLESMLISIATRDALPREPGRGFEPQRFWVTAARRATTGRAIAELIDPATRSESFTASLLQDLAIPLLSSSKGDEYGAVLVRWHDGDEDLARLERETFGWDHAEVAGWVCRAWDFPEPLTVAIGNHHGAADDASPQDALPAVGLVSVLREVDEQSGIEQLAERVEANHGIERDQTRELVRESFDAASDIARLFA